MSFDLDPVFHTETMVKILHAQGQVYYATKLCEELVEKSADPASAASLLEAIKKGHIPEKVPAYQKKVAAEPEAPAAFEDDITEPGITFEALEIKDEEQQLLAESVSEPVPSPALSLEPEDSVPPAPMEAAAEEPSPERQAELRKLSLLNELLCKVQERR